MQQVWPSPEVRCRWDVRRPCVPCGRRDGRGRLRLPALPDAWHAVREIAAEPLDVLDCCANSVRHWQSHLPPPFLSPNTRARARTKNHARSVLIFEVTESEFKVEEAVRIFVQFESVASAQQVGRVGLRGSRKGSEGVGVSHSSSRRSLHSSGGHSLRSSSPGSAPAHRRRPCPSSTAGSLGGGWLPPASTTSRVSKPLTWHPARGSWKPWRPSCRNAGSGCYAGLWTQEQRRLARTVVQWQRDPLGAGAVSRSSDREGGASPPCRMWGVEGLQAS